MPLCWLSTRIQCDRPSRNTYLNFFICFLARQPQVGQGLVIHEVSRSHTTTHHSRWDSSERVISSSQGPLPDAQHSQQKNVHASGGFRIHKSSRRAAADQRLISVFTDAYNSMKFSWIHRKKIYMYLWLYQHRTLRRTSFESDIHAGLRTKFMVSQGWGYSTYGKWKKWKFTRILLVVIFVETWGSLKEFMKDKLHTL